MWKHPLFWLWLAVTAALLGISYAASGEGFLRYAIAGILGLYVFVYFRLSPAPRKAAPPILAALLTAVISAIALLDNYVQAIRAEDGIGISNMVAYMYLGEDGWSAERFRQAFRVALAASAALSVLYAAALLFDAGRSGGKGAVFGQQRS